VQLHSHITDALLAGGGWTWQYTLDGRLLTNSNLDERSGTPS
jgi:hypothetical protein